MRRISRLLAMLLCLALLLSACGGGTTESSSSAAAESSTASTESSASSSGLSATSGGTTETEIAVKADPNSIVAAVNTEPGKLDPQNNASITGIMVERQIFEPLIDKDPATGELVPCLATEWSWDDDTHLRLKLREGVTFHNGEDFTAEDVLLTLERMQVGSASASLYATFDPANSVAEDDYTVIIAFTTPFAPALNFLTNGRAYIIPADYMNENGDDALNQNPIGTGPFEFVDWTISSHVNMKRYENYWGEKPTFENLQVRFITDDTARGMALETGELDVAFMIQETDINSILNGEVPHINGYMVPGQQVNYFGFNENNVPAFADIRVRQALAHAVDWESALFAANGDIFSLCQSCIAPTVDYYVPIGSYEYDVEKAKQLMEEAGYGDGLTFNCIEEEVQASVRLLEILQSYWAEIGVTMEIQVVDSATWQEANMNGTSDTSICNMTATTGDPHHTLVNVVAAGANITGKVTDEHFNELANEAMAEMDETRRAELYEELQQYMYDNVFQIPMFVKMVTYGVWDYIDGFVADPGQQVRFADITIKTA